jgi:hypothetical protein
MARTYPKIINGKKCELVSVTTITSASSDKTGLIRWSAKMTGKWIREYCSPIDLKAHYPYMVHEDDLNEAVEYYDREGKRAMGIGSNVHSHIEEFLNARRTSV